MYTLVLIAFIWKTFSENKEVSWIIFEKNWGHSEMLSGRYWVYVEKYKK